VYYGPNNVTLRRNVARGSDHYPDDGYLVGQDLISLRGQRLWCVTPAQVDNCRVVATE
jgi:hypothetical protein